MAAKIDIFNRAQQEVGGQPILLPDENSPGNRALNLAWDIVRQEVLAAHTWNGVVHRIQLAASSTSPVFGYDKVYPLPALTLRVVSVNETSSLERRWVVEADGILTDMGGTEDGDTALNVVYIRDEPDDTTKFGPMLISALAMRLALAIVERTTQSNTKYQIIQVKYDDIIKEARRMDVREQSAVSFFDSPYIEARFT